MNQVGTLIFFCGKMGAGKSTLSQELASERRAVCISEDQWLAALSRKRSKTLATISSFRPGSNLL
ncbi:AAA family ATPase [Shewanella algae]|uniref:AAA family ATPase n=1 Tax=Shewanella algae TaxID=38313 RepID=UPI00399AEBA6